VIYEFAKKRRSSLFCEFPPVREERKIQSQKETNHWKPTISVCLALDRVMCFSIVAVVSKVQYATGQADEPRIRVMCAQHIACMPEGTVVEPLRDGCLLRPVVLMRTRKARERQLRAVGLAGDAPWYVRVYGSERARERYLGGEWDPGYAHGYECLVDEIIRVAVKCPEMFREE